jgi:hypothetical protein
VSLQAIFGRINCRSCEPTAETHGPLQIKTLPRARGAE